MKKIILCLFTMLSLCVFINAQTTTETATTTAKKPAKVIFKATKEQTILAQKILKVDETGKMTKADRAVLKTYQTENGLKANGSLNRVTLEKMGIELTQKQKDIPVSENSMKSEKKEKPEKSTSRKAVFKATKEQVSEAQKIVKVSETGKLSKEDREAIKKYQDANGLKVTGTLNKVTLEKMGIALTDKQKQM